MSVFFVLLAILGMFVWSMLEKRPKRDDSMKGRLISRGPVKLVGWQELADERTRIRDAEREGVAAWHTKQFIYDQARARARTLESI